MATNISLKPNSNTYTTIYKETSVVTYKGYEVVQMTTNIEYILVSCLIHLNGQLSLIYGNAVYIKLNKGQYFNTIYEVLTRSQVHISRLEIYM
jgi:hypothetical protein